jgi:DNA-binding PucR family transcriptional regulator
MSIAFKNWVMEEQEKDEERMIYELKQKEFLDDIKMALRKVLSSETMTLDARTKVNDVIRQVNEEIIKIEKLVSDHEQQENAPC